MATALKVGEYAKCYIESQPDLKVQLQMYGDSVTILKVNKKGSILESWDAVQNEVTGAYYIYKKRG